MSQINNISAIQPTQATPVAIDESKAKLKRNGSGQNLAQYPS